MRNPAKKNGFIGLPAFVVCRSVSSIAMTTPCPPDRPAAAGPRQRNQRRRRSKGLGRPARSARFHSQGGCRERDGLNRGGIQVVETGADCVLLRITTVGSSSAFSRFSRGGSWAAVLSLRLLSFPLYARSLAVCSHRLVSLLVSSSRGAPCPLGHCQEAHGCLLVITRCIAISDHKQFFVGL